MLLNKELTLLIENIEIMQEYLKPAIKIFQQYYESITFSIY